MEVARSRASPGIEPILYSPGLRLRSTAQDSARDPAAPSFTASFNRPWPVEISGRKHKKMWETATRNPLLSFLLSGLFLLRYEQRALSRLLFQEPPRNTRKSLYDRAPHMPAKRLAYVRLVCLIQPPRRAPISLIILDTCIYCPSLNHSQRNANRR